MGEEVRAGAVLAHALGPEARQAAGSGSTWRSLVEDPGETFEVAPQRCAGCGDSLCGAPEVERVRRQVADVSPPPPPKVTEYQLLSRQCRGCGQVTTATVQDPPRRIDTDAEPSAAEPSAGPVKAGPVKAGPVKAGPVKAGPVKAGPVKAGPVKAGLDKAGLDKAGLDGSALGVVPASAFSPGSPVRIGPGAAAVGALLTCAHYLPIGRAAALFKALTGMGVSTGYLAGIRHRAAQLLETTFLPHMQALLPTAAVRRADETTGRAGGDLAWVHVACTEYLTLMHVGGRSSADIDAGGMLAEFTGT